MKLALAQLNLTVGDIAGNTDTLLAAAREAHAAGAAILVTPEMSICGYPAEDLVLRADFCAACAAALARIAREAPPALALLVGFPERTLDGLFNAVALVRGARVEAVYRKHHLPNHSVFDEARVFARGDAPVVFDCGGLRFGLNICGDIWEPGPAQRAFSAGADWLLVPNASPFHLDKQAERYAVARARHVEAGLPLVYVNLVGGQDELVFDGASFVMDADGEIAAQFPAFEPGLFYVEIDVGQARAARHPAQTSEAMAYAALVLAVRDYVDKNGFKGVHLGLSGGIDSALTLAIAVDAIGAERVHAVMMPSDYTASISVEDSRRMVAGLGVPYSEIAIKPIVSAFDAQLAPVFAQRAGVSASLQPSPSGGEGANVTPAASPTPTPAAPHPNPLPQAGEGANVTPAASPTPINDTTEENLQARARGTLLMALSNKFGTLVLTTGNKSEMATGYATLYGDMAGGFAVLKDVPKTLVYRLSAYRNGISAVIPQRIIDRPPSAELRPDQTDQDSLPPYVVLDAILAAYVERDASMREIVALGYDAAVVAQVIRLIERSEYKRRQAAPGPRITPRNFGKDRRYPITHQFRAEGALP